jgi:hypothetical protein
MFLKSKQKQTSDSQTTTNPISAEILVETLTEFGGERNNLVVRHTRHIAKLNHFLHILFFFKTKRRQRIKIIILAPFYTLNLSLLTVLV